jgi:hypothetical protein
MIPVFPGDTHDMASHVTGTKMAANRGVAALLGIARSSVELRRAYRAAKKRNPAAG